MRGAAFVAAASLVAIAACTPPSHTYFEDAATGVHVALPNEWQVADARFQGASGGNPLEVEHQVLGKLFAPAGQAVPTEFTPIVDYPIAYAAVVALTPEEQERFSLRRVRNLVFPVDATREQAPGTIIVLDQRYVVESGYRGERMLYSIKTTPDGSDPVTFTLNQTTYLDPFTTTAYVFLIGCVADCYLEQARTIKEIADSWSVVPA